MYPVAWAVVAIENYDAWYWFLSLLQKDLNICNGGRQWIIISDQQKVSMFSFCGRRQYKTNVVILCFKEIEN
jgi:hypothetical protein